MNGYDSGQGTASGVPEDLEVECTHCHLPMSKHLGSGGQVRYYRCAACQRWVSSTYAEIFRADGKFRARSPTEPTPERVTFESVKGKLERWLASVDDRDPYHTLGVSPLDADEVVRTRFRELAMKHHPDHGGAPDKMRELNLAYERILRHRADRRAERVAVSALPTRAR